MGDTMGRLITLIFLLLSTQAAQAEGEFKARWINLWLTPEQQGQRAFDSGDFVTAAKRYENPLRIGSAYYRAGEFEMAAGVFGRNNSPEGAYNRGTALVLLGQYSSAIEAYDLALTGRPDWLEAQQNRAIALARQKALEYDNDQRTQATEIGADDVVFDNQSPNKENQDEVTTNSDKRLSDQELRAMWLRKSQTSPAVFLKAKFSAQLATAEQKVPEE
jgi:Ca-activated chloride channel family protein